MSHNFITLSELNNSIKATLTGSFPDNYWIVAEISELNENRSGHCYLELIEKEVNTDRIKAKSRATIWAFNYRMLKSYFETVTNRTFTKDLKVLLQVQINFHEIYGLSLNVVEIDPTYTLGDIARRRQEIIAQLKNEGVFDMNKETEIPVAPQRIAVISSETAAGYGDFLNQLLSNSYNYKFDIHFFNATMQGDRAESSIIEAFDRIYESDNEFDVVCLIRGGGSKTDLSCFDSYDLAFYIAQFPIPVLTGIGHDRDQSIADMVAHSQLKTPTAVAEFLIDKLNEFETYIDSLLEHAIGLLTADLSNQRQRLQNICQRFAPLVKTILMRQQHTHDIQTGRVKSEVKRYIVKHSEQLNRMTVAMNSKLHQFLLIQKHKLLLYARTVELQNPQNILKKGYSITSKNGKVLKKTDELYIGDTLETKLFEGNIISSIISKDEQPDYLFLANL